MDAHELGTNYPASKLSVVLNFFAGGIQTHNAK